jgi:uncharacterized protein YjaG (DUF416 family)
MLDFDTGRLRAELTGLTRWQVAVFAATCVEVLIPSYVRFAEIEEVGDIELVRTTTDAVWAGLEADRLALEELSLPSPDEIMGLLPEEDDWNDWAPQAENAVGALYYLLRLLDSGELDLAVHVARQPYEAVDDLTARQLPDGGMLDAAGRTRLLESDPVQAELQRQEDVLSTLREAPDGGRSALAELHRSAASSAL